MLKRTYNKEQSVHIKSESCYIGLESESCYIGLESESCYIGLESQKNPFNLLNFKHIIYILQSIVVNYFFNTFINSWYLIIFFYFYCICLLSILWLITTWQTPSRNKIIISALYVIKIEKNIRRKCIFLSVKFWSSKLIKWQCF